MTSKHLNFGKSALALACKQTLSSSLNRLGVGNAIRDVALDMEQAELRTDEGHRIRVTASIASLENKMGVRPSGGVAHVPNWSPL